MRASFAMLEILSVKIVLTILPVAFKGATSQYILTCFLSLINFPSLLSITMFAVCQRSGKWLRSKLAFVIIAMMITNLPSLL